MTASFSQVRNSGARIYRTVGQILNLLGKFSAVMLSYLLDIPQRIRLFSTCLKHSTKRRVVLTVFTLFNRVRQTTQLENGCTKVLKTIPYAENDGHRALWETLAEWAKRAKAPADWHKSVVDLAKKGPVQLQPHERGQVAHIVSTIEGVRKFSEGDETPPAEWLCVFDPQRRYARPQRIGGFGEQGAFVDPFDLYGMDIDIAPKRIDLDKPFEKRDVPLTAWDAFAANRLDRKNLRDDSFSAIRGHWATNIPRLPSRLAEIGIWIMKVADQPAAVWWAATQSGLHPEIRERIQRQLERSHIEAGSLTRQAWRYLFEASGREQRQLSPRLVCTEGSD